MDAYEFNLPVNSEQLKASGMVAAEWSYLESIIDAGIWSLACLDEESGRAITTHLPLPSRLYILQTLFSLRHVDKCSMVELETMCEHIRNKLAPARNEIVHARWTTGTHGSPLIHSVQARKRLVSKRIGKPSPEITKLAGQIAAQSDKLSNFLRSHNALIDP